MMIGKDTSWKDNSSKLQNKESVMKKLIHLVVVSLVILFMPWWLFAQQEPTGSSPGQSESQMPAETQMSRPGMAAQQPEQQSEKSGVAEMKAHHDQMMAKMKEGERRLDEKVAAMNEAKKEEKSEAIAAVINELVSQRKEMRKRLMAMHGKMCEMMDKVKSDGMQEMSGGMKSKSGKPMVEIRSAQPGENGQGKSMIVIIQE